MKLNFTKACSHVCNLYSFGLDSFLVMVTIANSFLGSCILCETIEEQLEDKCHILQGKCIS